MSESSEKILNNNDHTKENANFGHSRSFLACFWPVMTPISVPKALNEFI